MARDTGPILLTTGEFELLTTRDFGAGPIVVPASRASWLLVGLAVAVGAVACAVLAFDRSAKVDDTVRLELANHAVEYELTAANAEIRATDERVKELEVDSVALARLRAADADRVASATRLERAFGHEFRREIRNGDVRVMRDGARVTARLYDWAVVDEDDDDVSVRGVDLLMRAGEVLASEDARGRAVDIVAYTDDRTQDPWATTAARAASVVAFVGENTDLDPGRLSAVARGTSDRISRNRARNRRVELVVDFD